MLCNANNPAGSCRNRDSPVKYPRVRELHPVSTCPPTSTPATCPFFALTDTTDVVIEMSPPEELEYLKSLVNQLNEKIKSLEEKAKSTVKQKTPAQQLRTILVGPPGSGLSPFSRSRDTFTK